MEIPGRHGNIGAGAAARSGADGYTFVGRDSRADRCQ